LREAATKKTAFVENQMVARTQTNLTPAELESFESVFRHFDEDGTNKLSLDQFASALSALGINFSDQETDDVHARLSDENGAISFESYLQFLVEIKEDTSSPEEFLEAFQSVSNGKGFIVARDLELARVPKKITDFLVSVMPVCDGPTTNGHHAYTYEPEQKRFDYGKFLQITYSN